MLQPTTSNLRAEIARHKLRIISIAQTMRIAPNHLYMLLREERPMKGNLPYRIGGAVNHLLGERIFVTPLDPEFGEQVPLQLLGEKD